jgi:predicted XRE-type DNA-binding protein
MKKTNRKPSKPKKLFSDVFEDLGFTPPEAARLRIQSDLAALVENYIEKKRFTDAQAAQRFGVSRARIHDLQAGKFDLFRVDDLIEMLARVGVTLTVKASQREPKG